MLALDEQDQVCIAGLLHDLVDAKPISFGTVLEVSELQPTVLVVGVGAGGEVNGGHVALRAGRKLTSSDRPKGRSRIPSQTDVAHSFC